ncbi:AMP-binding enzyme [Actinomyces ruminicola]|uniref:AMP-binding enzyme n=1 Tax=Actinomyces ruminicola TaxID=332524 RepID=UPI001FE09099|nr:AMP-binding protein [Actinomyces ruminicola]
MSSTTSFARPLFLLRGGTGPGDVAVLTAALRDRIGAASQASGENQARGAAGDPAAGNGQGDRAAGCAFGQRPPGDGPAGELRPLLVPIAPGEDPATVRADLARRLDPDGPAARPESDLLLRTSGSTTGTGALVAMSMAALTASARATHARLGGPGTWVLALPAHHIAGLQVLVRSLVADRAPVVVDTSRGFDPDALADAVERALASRPGAPVRVPLVPTQLVRVLAPGHERAAGALARADAVLLGGAAADPDLLQRARAAGVRVVTTYGMSETGGGCVYDGAPLDGVGVCIENPDAAGVGRIVLSGPVLAAGYAEVGSRPAGAAVFRERAGADGAGELLTSDLGQLVPGPDGGRRLAVLGRVDDMIITGGVKVAPREVEEVLTALPGVAQACVVGVPDAQWGSAVVAAVVPAGEGCGDWSAWEQWVRAAARDRLDGAHAPKRIVVVDALPLCGPGKVDRQAMARRFTSACRNAD